MGAEREPVSPAENVRKMYEDSADAYARMMDQEIGLPVYERLLGRLQVAIRDVPGLLLDTACGSGQMLAMFLSKFDAGREVLGVDLSPAMVKHALDRLGDRGSAVVGDMRSLDGFEDGSAAGVINFFAVHHLGADDVRRSMREWVRVLRSGGHLLLGAWEGSGTIDYGEEEDIIAYRYTAAELELFAEESGFKIVWSDVEPVEDFPMDAVYLDCLKA